MSVPPVLSPPLTTPTPQTLTAATALYNELLLRRNTLIQTLKGIEECIYKYETSFIQASTMFQEELQSGNNHNQRWFSNSSVTWKEVT